MSAIFPNFCETVLSADAAIEGLAALQQNASRLARDARIMLHARRFASAAALALAALGEFTRMPIVLELAEAMPAHRVGSIWTRFRQPLAAFPWPLFMEEATTTDAGQFSQLLDIVRVIGSAVDCVEGPVWLRPGDLITSEMARQLVVLAETLVRHPPEQQAMRLWLAVVATSPPDAPDEEVLARFQQALETEGLCHAAAMIDRYRLRRIPTEQAA